VTFYLIRTFLNFKFRRLLKRGFHKIRLITTNLNQNLQQVVSEFAAYVLNKINTFI
jgi:very-short-patch-repair endonuclease